MAIKTYVACYADGFSEDVLAIDFQAADDTAESRSALYGRGGVVNVLGPRAHGRATQNTPNVYL